MSLQQQPGLGHRGAGSGSVVRAYALCAFLAAISYVNALTNDFCEDDQAIIVGNPLVTADDGWGNIWRRHYWQHHADAFLHPDLLYRPVTIVSYRVNHFVHGLRASGFIVTAVILHVCVTLGVYRLMRRMTDRSGASLLAAAGFAVLPVHTEAVTHIVGRAELLAALFVLATLLAFAPPGGNIRRRPIAFRIGLGALAAFLAMASKETGLAIILLVPLFQWFWRSGRAPRSGPNGNGSRLSWRLIVAQLATVSIAFAVYMLLRRAALGGVLYQPVTLTKSVNVLVDATPWERFCGILQLWGGYWAKTVWPAKLVADYSINAVQVANGLLHPHVLFGLAVAVALVALAIWSWRRGQRAPAVWLGALVISYWPTSNSVVLIKVFFAERLWYLPSAWALMLLGWVAWRGVDGLGRRLARGSLVRGVSLACVMVILTAGIVRCWLRNPAWRSDAALVAANYHDHPDSIRALLGYGKWLARNGRYAEGMALMQRSVLIDPGFVDGHRQIGATMLAAGDLQGAVHHLSIADQAVPGHGPTQRWLAAAQTALASQTSAILDPLRRQVAQHPDDLDALLELAARLRDLGWPDAAAERLRRARDRFAADPRFLHELAVTQVVAGRRDDAVSTYRDVIAVASRQASARVELAMLLLDRRADGDMAEAKSLIETTRSLAPDDMQVQIAWAELRALEGHRREAAQLYRQIASRAPRGSDLREQCELRARFLNSE